MVQIAEFWSYLLSDQFITFYADNLRGSMFSAFMTLSGFLFTMHAFLLVTLYRDIYSKREYQDFVVNQGRKYNPKLKPNQPLRNVSRLLFATLVCTFATSTFQMTFGLIKHTWAVAICLFAAAATTCVFIVVLIVFRGIMKDWLDFIDKTAENMSEVSESEHTSES